MSWRRHFRAFAERTEPRAGATRRLQERVAWPGAVLRDHARVPAPGATARLAARLRAPSSPRAVSLRFLGASLLAAAAALLWVIGPGRPAALDETLSSPAPITESLTVDVSARYTGSGHVQGTTVAPRLRWEIGTLALDVTPKRGIDLTVETEEATVTVVGTSFAVTRDVLGTTVEVERGEVAVRCVGEGPLALRAGDRAVCPPMRPAGMLLRTRHLLEHGAAPDEVLAAIERGLSLAEEGDPAVGELLVLRMEVLLPLGRDAEALQDATRYLALGGPRHAEVLAVFEALGGAVPP